MGLIGPVYYEPHFTLHNTVIGETVYLAGSCTCISEEHIFIPADIELLEEEDLPGGEDDNIYGYIRITRVGPGMSESDFEIDTCGYIFDYMVPINFYETHKSNPRFLICSIQELLEPQFEEDADDAEGFDENGNHKLVWSTVPHGQNISDMSTESLLQLQEDCLNQDEEDQDFEKLAEIRDELIRRDPGTSVA